MLAREIAYIVFSGNEVTANVAAAKGCSVVRSGQGEYAITLDVAVDATAVAYAATVGQTNGTKTPFAIIETSDTVKTLFVSDENFADTDGFTARILFFMVVGGGVGGG